MSESFISKPIIVRSMPSDSGSFKKSTVKVQERIVHWKSANSQGSLDMLEIFKDMEKEKGFLVADEAYENLPGQVKSLVNADQLVQLTTASSYLFIEFEHWNDFEDWVNGNSYLEMLVTLNNMDGTSSSQVFRDSILEKAWVYDINYQFVTEEIIKYKVAFQETSKNIAIVQCEAIYEDINVSETVSDIFAKYKRYIDSVNHKIVEIFIQNSLREILAATLSKDIITPKQKGIEYTYNSPEKISNEYEKWFLSLESNFKAEQLSYHLQSLKESDDSIMQLFRILEIQKLALQISLARAYSQVDMHSEDIIKMESRLDDLRRSRHDINQSFRDNSEKRNYCNLDCQCILF